MILCRDLVSKSDVAVSNFDQLRRNPYAVQFDKSGIKRSIVNRVVRARSTDRSDVSSGAMESIAMMMLNLEAARGLITCHSGTQVYGGVETP